MAMAVTQIATAAAALAWMFVEWLVHKKPSVLGIISGAVAGLVAITPASGFVGPVGALWIGVAAGVGCFFAATTVKRALGYDDSLDVFGVHGVGGIIGAILTGVFALKAIGGASGATRRQCRSDLDPDRRRGRHPRLVRHRDLGDPDRRQHADRREGESGRRSRRSRHQPAWRGGASNRHERNQLQGLRLTTRAGSPPLTSALALSPGALPGLIYFVRTSAAIAGTHAIAVTLPHGESDRAHLSRRPCRLAFRAPRRAARGHRARRAADRPVARRAPRADPVFPRTDARAPSRASSAATRRSAAFRRFARPSPPGSDAAIRPSPATSTPRRTCCRSTARARDCSRRSFRRWRGKSSVERPAVLIPNPVLSGLCRSRGGLRRRADLPGERRSHPIPARARQHRRGAVAADRRALSLLAVEPARRRRRPRLSRRRHRARAALRLHAVRRRMLFGDLWRRPAPGRARDGVCAETAASPMS